MKTHLAVLIFASLVLITVFGFAAMNHGAGHCVASAVQGAVCPTNDLLGFASFHLGFFKNFGNAVFSSLLVGAVLLIFALFVLFLKSLKSADFYSKRTINRGTGGGESITSPVRTIREWLSLLENSPSAAFALR